MKPKTSIALVAPLLLIAIASPERLAAQQSQYTVTFLGTLGGCCGEVLGINNVSLTIPPGVTEGQQIRLGGQGSPGSRGGRAGDLYLEISFAPHPIFRANGHDLAMTLPIAPWEAALGANVPVPTLAGPVDMRIPPNAKGGQKLRLKGRGMPASSSSGAAGDQYVTLKIVVPPADTPRARELYQQMQRELAFDPRAELGKPS